TGKNLPMLLTGYAVENHAAHGRKIRAQHPAAEEHRQGADRLQWKPWVPGWPMKPYASHRRWRGHDQSGYVACSRHGLHQGTTHGMADQHRLMQPIEHLLDIADVVEQSDPP